MPTQTPIQLEHRGMTMRGMAYLPIQTGRRPTVLFLHSFAGNRIEAGFGFVRLARSLNALGIAAVTFDYLHSGESDGSFEQMLASGELADAQRMAEFVAGQPFVDRTRVGLLGFSLGGLLASCLNARVKMFRSLALIAPTTSQNLVTNVLKRADASGKITIGAHTLHPKFTDDVLKFDPLADVVKNPRPTLVVQGTGDPAVAPAVSQLYVDAMKKAGLPVTHHLVADADHTFGHPLWQKQLIAHVTEFFASTL